MDNARDFVSLRGLESLVVPALKGPANVSAMATMLVGSAVQNNPPVKNYVTKIGLIDFMLANLEKKDGASSIDLKSKTVFALSSLLRENPEGVDHFSNALGLERLLEHVMNFEVRDEDARMPAQLVRLRVKCLSFVAHLLADHRPQVEAAWTEDMESWCKVINSADLYSDLASSGPADLGRVEVLSEVLKVTSHVKSDDVTTKTSCQLETAAVEWLRKAHDVIKAEMDDEDDPSFLQHLTKISVNIATLLGHVVEPTSDDQNRKQEL